MSLLGWPAAALALLPAPFGRSQLKQRPDADESRSDEGDAPPASELSAPAPATASVNDDGAVGASNPTATFHSGSTALSEQEEQDAAELAGLKSIFADSSRRRRGWHVVEEGGHRIYYELHGDGPKHVVLLMGLSNTSFSWTHQVAHFTSPASASRYSVLVLDNRGSGFSGYPTGRYSTSAMADDVASVLDHLGWTGEAEVDLVGLSMGGMIALELARRVPGRIRSLVLAVTSSGHGVWRNLPPRKGFEAMRRLTLTAAPKDRMTIAVEMLFPTAWLDEQDPVDAQSRTNRETRLEEYAYRYSLTRPQLLSGNIGQSLACLTHHVPPASLAEIGRSIAKVCVVVGDDDAMVDVANSDFLYEHLRQGGAEEEEESDATSRVELVRWEKTGHAIHLQWPKRFNALLKRVWAEADERVDGA